MACKLAGLFTIFQVDVKSIQTEVFNGV